MKMREKVHTKNSLIGLIKSSFIAQVQGDCCCCIMHIVHSEMYVQEKRLIGSAAGAQCTDSVQTVHFRDVVLVHYASGSLPFSLLQSSR